MLSCRSNCPRWGYFMSFMFASVCCTHAHRFKSGLSTSLSALYHLINEHKKLGSKTSMTILFEITQICSAVICKCYILKIPLRIYCLQSWTLTFTISNNSTSYCPRTTSKTANGGSPITLSQMSCCLVAWGHCVKLPRD